VLTTADSLESVLAHFGKTQDSNLTKAGQIGAQAQVYLTYGRVFSSQRVGTVSRIKNGKEKETRHIISFQMQDRIVGVGGL